MPEGVITIFNKESNSGWIKSTDGESYQFRAANVTGGSGVFDTLKKGDVVYFELQINRLSQQEISNIRRPNIGKYTHHSNKQSAAVSKLPYGFTVVNTGQSVVDTPIKHDGSNGGELLSGEICCTLTALTPLLAGNERFSVNKIDPKKQKQWQAAFLGLNKKFDKDKQVAEPLRLPDGRVVIAGSAMKGMIRHSISALLSAPMERVAERHYSYRPNTGFAKKKEKYEVRPARVIQKTDTGWEIELFKDARDAIFVRNNAENHIKNKAQNDIVSGSIKGIEYLEYKYGKKRIQKAENKEYLFSGRYRIVTYKGGIDGKGLLAQAFKGRPGSFTYRCALVPEKGVCPAQIPDALYQRYLKDQKNVIANDLSGHLKAHPLNFNVNAVKNSIFQHRELESGQLIYVEVTTDSNGNVSNQSEVTSFGHHFQYRWAYTSSVRKKGDRTRECLTPKLCELVPQGGQKDADVAPEQLTGARLLFGYVHDDDTPVGKGVYERIAGRIAFNHAVSQNNPQFLGSEESGYCVPLKTLGQPKPSSWEFYLQQPAGNNRPNTYGDLPDDTGGELAGRKYYRHQPSVQDVDDIKETDKELIASNQSTLARFICAPNTTFRFTIRFARLREWELGALLAGLQPQHLDQSDQSVEYAHKLGLGRPLGMGSVGIAVNQLHLRQEKAVCFMPEDSRKECKESALKALKEKLAACNIKDWLKMHDFTDRGCLDYPREKNTIHGWHTSIRRDYSELRREQQPNWKEINNKIHKAR